MYIVLRGRIGESSINFFRAGGGAVHRNLFYHIISVSNLLAAWQEFRRGKNKKPDVQKFEFNLERNLFLIHKNLKEKTYMNEPYIPFYVYDPKRRYIHKAQVVDRVVHQAISRILYEVYDKSFIYDSYACRLGKGTHRGVKRLEKFIRKETKNYTRNAWALKCDIYRFFDSINHQILENLLFQKVLDKDTRWLLENIIKSFAKTEGKGLPLGNVTSQLFANVYLNTLDRFMKHSLKAKYYVRYCDDFVIISRDREYLESIIPKISKFLQEKLKVFLHPEKIRLCKISQGVDFLGYILLPHYRILRPSTKRRMQRRAKGNVKREVKTSYLGVLSHCKGYKISKILSIL